MGPVPSNYEVYGFTPPFQPKLNYTASNPSPMDMLITQVHELGHSLTNLINLRYPGDLGDRNSKIVLSKRAGLSTNDVLKRRAESINCKE